MAKEAESTLVPILEVSEWWRSGVSGVSKRGVWYDVMRTKSIQRVIKVLVVVLCQIKDVT